MEKNTHAARAVNGKLRIVAECGDVDTRLADDRQHIAFPVKRHPLPVDDHNSLSHGSLLLYGVDSAEGTRAPACAAMDALLVVDGIRHAGLAGDGLHGTVLGALAAALTQIRLDLQPPSASVAYRTVVIHHMVQIVLPEMPQRGHDRLAGRLSQTAQRRVGDGIAERLQQLQIIGASLVGDDPLLSLIHI